MASACFVVWPEAGHARPMALVAKRLEARGHDIRFVGFPDFRAVFENEGVRFEPIGEDLFPLGTLPRASVLSGTEAYDRMVRAFAAGELANRFDANLVCVDFLMPFAALAALRCRQRVVTVYTNFPYRRAEGLPPLTSARLPGSSLRRRIGVRAAWSWRLAIRTAYRTATAATGRINVWATLQTMASQAGYPSDLVHRDCALGYALDLPELVFCPRVLELPYAVPSHRRYVESAIGEIAGEATCSGGDSGSSDLVICALGSQTHLYRQRHLDNIFGAFVRCATQRPDLRWVLAHGEYDPARLSATPPNLRVERRIPQLALLAQARLLVCHGGLNSVKEALWHGVPLAILPLVTDQPGNAARVAFHELGVAGSADWPPRRIAKLLLGALADPRYGARANLARTALRKLERELPGVELLDQALRDDLLLQFDPRTRSIQW